MGANPHTNGGKHINQLSFPDFKEYGLDVKARSQVGPGDTLVLGTFIGDIIKMNSEHKNFSLFGPDETLSNKLNACI